MKSLLADPVALGDYLSNLIQETNKINQQEQPKMQESFQQQHQPSPQFSSQYQPSTPPNAQNPSDIQQSKAQAPALVPMGRDSYYVHVDPLTLAQRQAEFQMQRRDYPTQSTDGKTRFEDVHPAQRWQILDRLEKEKVFGQAWNN